MRLAILAISSNENVIARLKRAGDRVFPATYRSKKYYESIGAKFSIDYFQYEKGDLEQLRKRYKSFISDKRGFIILLDNFDFSDIEIEFCEAAFCLKSDFGLRNPNDTANAFEHCLVSALNAFSHIHRRMCDYKFQKALLLPGENFRSKPWFSLRALLRASTRPGDFEGEADKLLAQVRQTQKPKRAQRPPRDDVYFVDDRGLCFAHGPEHHARPETKMPPHNFRCGLNAKWRFGVRYDLFDGDKHYNVSVDKLKPRIKMSIVDCHGVSADIEREKHVNLFPNSYYT